MKATTIGLYIPIFNQAEYIELALKSAQSQGLMRFDELVISDNYSTDGLEKIIKEGDNIKIIKPPYHMDMNEHWKWLVEQGKSDYFMVLSADDWLESDYLLNVKSLIFKYPDAALIVGGANICDQKRKVLKEFKPTMKEKVFEAGSLTYELHTGPNISFAAYLVNRKAYEDVGGFNSELKLCADWCLWVALSRKHKIVKTEAILGNYRFDYREGIYEKRLQDIISDEKKMWEIFRKEESRRRKYKIFGLRYWLAEKIRIYRKYIEMKREIANKPNFQKLFEYYCFKIGGVDKLVMKVGVEAVYCKVLLIVFLFINAIYRK